MSGRASSGVLWRGSRGKAGHGSAWPGPVGQGSRGWLCRCAGWLDVVGQTWCGGMSLGEQRRGQAGAVIG